MKIKTLKTGEFQLSDFSDPIELKTNSGRRIGIQINEDDFLLAYGGKQYMAIKDLITLKRPSLDFIEEDIIEGDLIWDGKIGESKYTFIPNEKGGYVLYTNKSNGFKVIYSKSQKLFSSSSDDVFILLDK